MEIHVCNANAEGIKENYVCIFTNISPLPDNFCYTENEGGKPA